MFSKFEFVNDFNLKKHADYLGVKIWQTPSFLFLMMGFIAFVIMIATYLISKNHNNPEILIIAECLVASVVLIVGTFVVRFVDQIIKIDKMKSEFVSVASHQLRTPLSIVKWETEMLLKRKNNNFGKKELKNLKNIETTNQRMIKLVNDLLDVARIEQKKIIFKKEKFDFSKVVKEIFSDFSSIAKKRRIGFTLKAEKKFPKVFGDSDKIRLVVENFIGNAIKYVDNGGRIEIKLSKKGRCLVFEIKDNGIGIPKKQIERVFEKFFRGENVINHQAGGTGLGLYISKSIIEQSGGKIWFESVEKSGSCFGFSLPL